MALDVALAAAAVPNDVTDEMFAEMRRHWTDEQIVEIVGVISLFGFMNRWNDTMATPLEEEAVHTGRNSSRPRLERRPPRRLVARRA